MDDAKWVGEVVEAWRANHTITLRLLDAIPDDGLLCTLSSRGGRTVGRQFAHLQSVRVMQLEARAKSLANDLAKFEAGDEPDRKSLRDALEESAARVEEWLCRAAAGEKGFRTFKRGLATTLAYLVAHEAHHRGNILLTLKQCGRPVDRETRYGIWDWDRV